MREEKYKSFKMYLEKRTDESEMDYFDINIIKKAYYVGAYTKAVIIASEYSEVSKKNETFKK